MAADDRDAFTELYHRYWDQLFVTANKIIHDVTASQDAVQEVFVSFWQRRKEVDIQSVPAYLHRSTRNQVYKAIRDKKIDDKFYERLKNATISILEESPLLLKEQQELLLRIIDSLPAECRETFRLSRVEGKTYKEIAAHFGISQKTVEWRMSRCLQHLRDNRSFDLFLLVVITAPQLN